MTERIPARTPARRPATLAALAQDRCISLEAGRDRSSRLEGLFDHVEINVSDMDVSRRFFEAALASLGYEIAYESPELVDMRAVGRSDFGLVRRDPVGPTVHLAFEAPDRAAVDAFHGAALAAGGRDNGAPGLRPEYGDNYYAAFVLGPDGHNIEAVTKRGAGPDSIQR